MNVAPGRVPMGTTAPLTSAKMSSRVRPVTAWYMLSRFVHSGRSGLSHSSPVKRSVLHFLIFLEITSGVSNRLIRELSFSALLDILLVPSCQRHIRQSRDWYT